MIPKIERSRCQLFSYLHDFEGGARVFGVSCDVYPELFELAHPDIVEKAPAGWRPNPKGNCRYLWFPPDALAEEDVEAIEEWRDRFSHYVLLGPNRNFQDQFTDELDFCLALDYNFDPKAEKRTLYGEAEYQLKYQHSRPHLTALQFALADAFPDLPIPHADREGTAMTCVPTPPGKCSVPQKLATAVAASLGKDYMQADLLSDKSAMKELTVQEKIPEWEKLYSRSECVVMHGDANGRTLVVIDDLYQSGATMWCYAKYLKQRGAKAVLGLVCVKSLRDTDNR